MTLRLFVSAALAPRAELDLPAGAARHVQVRRLQPGDALALFDGRGQDWPAQVLAIGRREVRVRLGEPQAVVRELPVAVTLACGMPANERMDALVEKATELGAAAIQPLLCERSVLRLEGERAERRRAHWQAVAAGACEQSGRAVVPEVRAVTTLAAWLARPPDHARRLLLSTAPAAPPLPAVLALDAGRGAADAFLLLSGPEGGFSAAEEAAATAAGYAPVTLGPRILRADTAPLAALAWIATTCSTPST